MAATIHVLGSLNQDIAASVTRHPAPGETVLAQSAVIGPGGKGLNQAVAAARLSRPGTPPVRMIGLVGEDPFGHALQAFMIAESIEARGVQRVPNETTGLGLITVDARGQNVITVVPGANMNWADTMPPLELAAGDCLVAQLEIPQAVTAAGFARARRAGATTILNPAPYQAISGDVLAQTDVLILNEIEVAQAAESAGDGTQADMHLFAARALLARGPHTVIVTLGAAGALVVERSGRTTPVPGLKLIAVDTTGAGDCFVGAYAVALQEGADAVTAARFANRAAGLSVTRRGAAASMPYRSEVLTAEPSDAVARKGE